MQFHKSIETIREIHCSFLKYIEDENNIEENYENLVKLIIKQKIMFDKYEIKSFLYLLLNVCNNHRRVINMYEKVEKILIQFKENIKNYFSDFEIFDYFKSNKRVLLSLFDTKIIAINQEIYDEMILEKYQYKNYLEYFQPEILKFNPKHENLINDISSDFYEKRKIGENDNYICNLIQNDLIEEFIIYVNKNDYPLNSKIQPSIFETNPCMFLNTSLIEYSAFFGAIQIFKYLYLNHANLDSKIWFYAIHSDNSEMINYLQENLPFNNDTQLCKECIKKSIKCHHNDITNYFLNNFSEKVVKSIYNEKKFANNIVYYCLHYYNFTFLPTVTNDNYNFYYFCEYDYYKLVKFYFETKDINLNEKVIENQTF